MRSTLLLAASILAVAASASATTYNGVANGDFTALQGGAPVTETSGLQFGANANGVVLQGWTNYGYNFVFTPGVADESSANGSNEDVATTQYGALYLWGPNSTPNNGTPAADNTFNDESPTGGNFIGADGAYEVGPLTTTITGLKAGNYYTLSFDYAGIQQWGYTGDTTEAWTVTIGGTTYSTPVLDDNSHDFTGWYTETIKFIASGTTEALSFTPVGTPGGVPPFALLANVSVPVPEPAAWSLMLLGVAGCGAIMRQRRARTLTA